MIFSWIFHIFLPECDSSQSVSCAHKLLAAAINAALDSQPLQGDTNTFLSVLSTFTSTFVW
jgi:hypothetical protein